MQLSNQRLTLLLYYTSQSFYRHYNITLFARLYAQISQT